MAETDLYECMKTLRAVRRLRPDPIPVDVLRRVLDAARWAPTGGNRQPWRMIVVRDERNKKRLAELYRGPWQTYAAHHRKLLESARPEAAERQERMLRAGDYLAENFERSPVLVVFCFNPKEMAITDAGLDRPSVVGGGSVYTAVENLLLACRAEGLGCTLTTLLCSCEDEVRSLLGIPDPWYTAAVIPIGYPLHRGHGPIRRRPLEQLAFGETWGTTFEDGTGES
jgi:nitroreductase